ncbi:MAG: OmpH family outer membrane protein [Proteobacteria bacterium]|nr:OmpH family outer membrane protein [Pseudomonadota bacterium]
MRKLLMAAVVALGVGSVAQAQSQKVGFVDMQRALFATAQGKKFKETMDGEVAKRKKELDKRKGDLDKMIQDLDKKKSVLSEEVMQKKQMEVQEESLKLQKYFAENQMELQKKEKELSEPLIEKMRKVIDRVANEKGYSMVLERSGQNVLFAQKDIDLTDAVVAAFEKEK